jgi:hypothetical protein
MPSGIHLEILERSEDRAAVAAGPRSMSLGRESGPLTLGFARLRRNFDLSAQPCNRIISCHRASAVVERWDLCRLNRVFPPPALNGGPGQC